MIYDPVKEVMTITIDLSRIPLWDWGPMISHQYAYNKGVKILNRCFQS